ncbi:MAG: PT domain-containing protein [Promethearchaeota archaeon]
MLTDDLEAPDVVLFLSLMSFEGPSFSIAADLVNGGPSGFAPPGAFTDPVFLARGEIYFNQPGYLDNVYVASIDPGSRVINETHGFPVGVDGCDISNYDFVSDLPVFFGPIPVASIRLASGCDLTKIDTQEKRIATSIELCASMNCTGYSLYPPGTLIQMDPYTLSSGFFTLDWRLVLYTGKLNLLVMNEVGLAQDFSPLDLSESVFGVPCFLGTGTVIPEPHVCGQDTIVSLGAHSFAYFDTPPGFDYSEYGLPTVPGCNFTSPEALGDFPYDFNLTHACDLSPTTTETVLTSIMKQICFNYHGVCITSSWIYVDGYHYGMITSITDVEIFVEPVFPDSYPLHAHTNIHFPEDGILQNVIMWSEPDETLDFSIIGLPQACHCNFVPPIVAENLLGDVYVFSLTEACTPSSILTHQGRIETMQRMVNSLEKGMVGQMYSPFQLVGPGAFPLDGYHVAIMRNYVVGEMYILSYLVEDSFSFSENAAVHSCDPSGYTCMVPAIPQCDAESKSVVLDAFVSSYIETDTKFDYERYGYPTNISGCDFSSETLFVETELIDGDLQGDWDLTDICDPGVIDTVEKRNNIGRDVCLFYDLGRCATWSIITQNTASPTMSPVPVASPTTLAPTFQDVGGHYHLSITDTDAIARLVLGGALVVELETYSQFILPHGVAEHVYYVGGEAGQPFDVDFETEGYPEACGCTFTKAHLGYETLGGSGHMFLVLDPSSCAPEVYASHESRINAFTQMCDSMDACHEWASYEPGQIEWAGEVPTHSPTLAPTAPTAGPPTSFPTGFPTYAVVPPDKDGLSHFHAVYLMTEIHEEGILYTQAGLTGDFPHFTQFTYNSFGVSCVVDSPICPVPEPPPIIPSCDVIEDAHIPYNVFTDTGFEPANSWTYGVPEVPAGCYDIMAAMGDPGVFNLEVGCAPEVYDSVEHIEFLANMMAESIPECDGYSYIHLSDRDASIVGFSDTIILLFPPDDPEIIFPYLRLPDIFAEVSPPDEYPPDFSLDSVVTKTLYKFPTGVRRGVWVDPFIIPDGASIYSLKFAQTAETPEPDPLPEACGCDFTYADVFQLAPTFINFETPVATVEGFILRNHCNSTAIHDSDSRLRVAQQMCSSADNCTDYSIYHGSAFLERIKYWEHGPEGENFEPIEIGLISDYIVILWSGLGSHVIRDFSGVEFYDTKMNNSILGKKCMWDTTNDTCDGSYEEPMCSDLPVTFTQTAREYDIEQYEGDKNILADYPVPTGIEGCDFTAGTPINSNYVNIGEGCEGLWPMTTEIAINVSKQLCLYYGPGVCDSFSVEFEGNPEDELEPARVRTYMFKTGPSAPGELVELLYQLQTNGMENPGEEVYFSSLAAYDVLDIGIPVIYNATIIMGDSDEIWSNLIDFEISGMPEACGCEFRHPRLEVRLFNHHDNDFEDLAVPAFSLEGSCGPDNVNDMTSRIQTASRMCDSLKECELWLLKPPGTMSDIVGVWDGDSGLNEDWMVILLSSHISALDVSFVIDTSGEVPGGDVYSTQDSVIGISCGMSDTECPVSHYQMCSSLVDTPVLDIVAAPDSARPPLVPGDLSYMNFPYKTLGYANNHIPGCTFDALGLQIDLLEYDYDLLKICEASAVDTSPKRVAIMEAFCDYYADACYGYTIFEMGIVFGVRLLSSRFEIEIVGDEGFWAVDDAKGKLRLPHGILHRTHALPLEMGPYGIDYGSEGYPVSCNCTFNATNLVDAVGISDGTPSGVIHSLFLLEDACADVKVTGYELRRLTAQQACASLSPSCKGWAFYAPGNFREVSGAPPAVFQQYTMALFSELEPIELLSGVEYTGAGSQDDDVYYGTGFSEGGADFSEHAFGITCGLGAGIECAPPTEAPTPNPTLSPTPPTLNPSQNPSTSPTLNPTTGPSVSPTEGPTVNPTYSPTEECFVECGTTTYVDQIVGLGSRAADIAEEFMPTPGDICECDILNVHINAPDGEIDLVNACHPATDRATLEIICGRTCYHIDADPLAPDCVRWTLDDNDICIIWDIATTLIAASPGTLTGDICTVSPTESPTTTPTNSPTGSPTTHEPTVSPTATPSNSPTGSPTTHEPTVSPTATPSNSPTLSPNPPVPLYLFLSDVDQDGAEAGSYDCVGRAAALAPTFAPTIGTCTDYVRLLTTQSGGLKNEVSYSGGGNPILDHYTVTDLNGLAFGTWDEWVTGTNADDMMVGEFGLGDISGLSELFWWTGSDSPVGESQFHLTCDGWSSLSTTYGSGQPGGYCLVPDGSFIAVNDAFVCGNDDGGNGVDQSGGEAWCESVHGLDPGVLCIQAGPVGDLSSTTTRRIREDMIACDTDTYTAYDVYVMCACF